MFKETIYRTYECRKCINPRTNGVVPCRMFQHWEADQKDFEVPAPEFVQKRECILPQDSPVRHDKADWKTCELRKPGWESESSPTTLS